MNQEKIGKFISELRKGKNMTQVDLATKLGVTDRAVSKWENGRGMPDLSLIRQLCDELGITINELLSGERINKKDYEEKFEENILKTIDYTDKRIGKTKRIFKISLIIVISFILCFISMFIVDINRMNNNEPVLFSTWGYDYTPAIDLHDEEIELAILEYLQKENNNQIKKHDNEKWFISFRIYLLEEKKRDSLYNVYAWVLGESYYDKNNDILKESGFSIPYKFVVENNKDNFVVTKKVNPRDGSLYDDDMKKIFPSYVIRDMKNVYTDGTIERLEMDIQKQVKLYFHK